MAVHRATLERIRVTEVHELFLRVASLEVTFGRLTSVNTVWPGAGLVFKEPTSGDERFTGRHASAKEGF